jgi:RimJ/RimL family protein N-acetyltransferase
VIKGKIIKLRALEESDLSKLKDLRNNFKTRIHTREFRLLNMINQVNWFESLFLENPPKNIMFGILNNKNNLIGICGLTYIDWKNRNAEISIIVDESKQKFEKEALEAIQIMSSYGFDELGLHRIWAEVFELAPERIKLFEKMNFKKEGNLRDKLWRNKKWYDSLIFAKLADGKHNEKNKTF